jgi:hypothetical protein
MTCRELAPPVGFIAFLELMKDLHSLLRSGLRSFRPTMPSADFCLSPACYHTGRFRIPDDHAHHSHLTHDRQISPDKNVNCPCTAAAFTLSPEPVGFVVSCQLARRLSLLCDFCSSVRTYALRLPSDHSSRNRPCLRLVLLIVFII